MMRILRREGFTLTELVVVVVLIGILATLVIPQYIKTMERSRQSEGYTNLAFIRGAQLRYYAEYSSYTTDTVKLDIDMPTGKYFNFGLPATVTAATVATAARNNTQNAAYGNYLMTVAADGTVTKGSGAP